MTRRVKLKQYAESIEPGVVVVEPWVLRRIIRLDGRVQGFRQLLSRRETYPIERNRLLGLVDSRELELTSPGSMPERLVVLAEPVEWDAADAGSSESHVNRLARPLFHACAHLEVAERFARDPAAHRVMAERRRQLGETVFAEIHAVLVQGDRLFPGSSDIDVYVEFVASYVEMRYFAPQTLSCYFPGVRDWQAVNTIIRQDIDYEAVFERLPIRGEDDARGHDESRGEIKSAAFDGTITLAEFRQLQMQAEFASIAGNHVQAALLHASASIHGPERHSDEARAAACGELTKLAMRLRVPLRLSVEEAGDWARSLPALLVPSSDRLTSVEARLLYDIQKACVEHERRVHRTSLWRWILTRGKRPCVHPLPLLRHALTQRHLRRALRRLSATSLDAASRQHLTDLFARALSVVETRSRHRLRRIIGDVFDEFGVHPENVPERVAREKIIEELIDGILERSHVTMADLRDALSKNDLKLPDVAGLGGFLRGDRLLKVDRACSDTLEGVYRRGAVYQRWPQMLSSLAFGTRTGRFLTRFVAVPYGGAYLTLEFLGHLGRYFGLHGRSADALAPPSSTPPTEPVTLDWLFVAAVVCLGTWASLLVHRPAFLHWNVSLLRKCGRGLRKWFVDFPVNVVRSKAVQSILASYAFRVFENYAFRPVLTTALLVLVGRAIGLQLSHRAWFEIALVAALFLNSALGRFVDEVTTQFLMRVWRDLRIHVIGSLAHWTMEVFQGLETALERMINFIDDWLRLRRGSRRATRTFKMLGGVLWFVVAYVVTFVFTLLVEPQINPIKHFPVVTVAQAHSPDMAADR